ncbi:hypothetical protein KS18_04020 [Photorhabdus luminescens]|nr:hypothetical protein KS18_04020 [Photorhabdus luminescens]
MNTRTSLPQAFILTGAFWVICRNSLYLTQLAERGLAILVMTPELYRHHAENARSDRNSPISLISEVTYVEGTLDKEASFNPDAIAAIQEWRQRYKIVGAFAVGETLVEPTGLFTDALDIRSPGLRATRVCRSKYLQRFYLNQYNPHSQIVPPGKRSQLMLEAMPYPMIIKPATRHSSSGVISVDNAKQAHAVLLEYPDHETLLLEQKVIGQEYSVESLIQNGTPLFSSVTHKVTTDTHSNTFVELAHTVPCKEPTSAILIEATERVLADLAFADGIAHSEWRLSSEGKPYLMEIAARTPGDGLLPLYQLACGKPLEPAILHIMLGEKAEYPAPHRVARQVYLEHHPGLLMDVRLNWPGVEVKWISDSDTWPDIPSGYPDDAPTLRAVFVHKQRGERLYPLRSSDDRAVAFFIDATTIEELDQLEAQVKASITLEIKDYHD